MTTNHANVAWTMAQQLCEAVKTSRNGKTRADMFGLYNHIITKRCMEV